jgi:hypothetical protein
LRGSSQLWQIELSACGLRPIETRATITDAPKVLYVTQQLCRSLPGIGKLIR